MAKLNAVARAAEKNQLLTHKLVLDENGVMVWPKPPKKEKNTNVPKAADLDSKYVVGDCWSMSSMSCWMNQPKDSYKCLKNAEGKYQCYCKYWDRNEGVGGGLRAVAGFAGFAPKKRYAKDGITDSCVVRSKSEEELLARSDTREFTCDESYGPAPSASDPSIKPTMPFAHQICVSAETLQTLLDERMTEDDGKGGKQAKAGMVKRQVAVQTAMIGVGVAGGVGSVLTILAAAGLAVSPFGVAVAPCLLVAGLSLMLADRAMKKALEAVALQVKRFILKSKVMMQVFDIANDVTLDLEGLRERVFNFATGDHISSNGVAAARSVSVAKLVSNEDAYVALQRSLDKGAEAAEEDGAAEKAAAAKAAFDKAMDDMDRSQATTDFAAWMKTPAKTTCMMTVMNNPIGWNQAMTKDYSKDWQEIKGTDNDKANCGYLKLQRYNKDLSLSLTNALNARMTTARKLADKYLPAGRQASAKGVDTSEFMYEFTQILDAIEAKWPEDASPSLKSLLKMLRQVNKAVHVANVFLGVGAGVASIAGAENLARNAAKASHAVLDKTGQVG